MVRKHHPSPSSSSAPPPSSEWPDQAVAILLKTYSEKFSVDRGYLRTSDWEEVARNVNTSCHDLKTLKTIKQCRDKIDSLKRRYKMEKLKAVNGGEVNWPFFHRLDAIMNSMLKQSSRSHHVHAHQKNPAGSSFLQGADNVLVEHDEDAQELQVDEKLEYSDSHDDMPTSSDSTSYSEDDRAAAPDRLNNLSDDGRRPYTLPQDHRHLINGIPEHYHLQRQQLHRYLPYQQDQYHPPQHSFRDPHLHPHHRFPLFVPPKPYSFVGATQESTEDSGHGKAEPASQARKRKPETENGIVALANAVTGLSRPGFPEVFARIDEAKMKIFAKMNVEIAKLEKKAQRSRNKRPNTTSSGP